MRAICFLFSGALACSLSFSALSNEITVNFQALYTAPTCTIGAPASVSFNQGEYVSGIPSTAIQADNIQNSFNLTFSDCSTPSLPAVPKITVTGNVITANGIKLFSDNTDAEGQTIGYGVKLSTPGNALFNGINNLADNGTITATSGTIVSTLNNQNLPIKAVLTCGADSCSSSSANRGGTFTANVIFRLSYE